MQPQKVFERDSYLSLFCFISLAIFYTPLYSAAAERSSNSHTLFFFSFLNPVDCHHSIPHVLRAYRKSLCLWTKNLSWLELHSGAGTSPKQAGSRSWWFFGTSHWACLTPLKALADIRLANTGRLSALCFLVMKHLLSNWCVKCAVLNKRHVLPVFRVMEDYVKQGKSSRKSPWEKWFGTERLTGCCARLVLPHFCNTFTFSELQSHNESNLVKVKNSCGIKRFYLNLNVLLTRS